MRIGILFLLCLVGALGTPGVTSTAYADDASAVVFLQSFDGVTAPGLPPDWTTSASVDESSWVTQAISGDGEPNSAYVPDAAQVVVSDLISPLIALPLGNSQLAFRNSYSLEHESSQPTLGYDGGVLEISISGGAWADVVTAGGSFVSGGYNATISQSFSNPLAGRQAWSGDSGGFVTTLLNLPAAGAGQNIQLRWRCGTDESHGNNVTNGWSIDSISIVNFASNSVSPNVLVDGSRTYQVIEGFGVNANSGSWSNDDLQSTIDTLIDDAGMTLFLVEFVGNCNWESTNANPGPSLTNWSYFDSVYTQPKFQQLWDMMAYLNQRGITNGAMPKFTGPTALWLGGDWIEPGYEGDYAKMLASALIYARKTRNLQFTVVPPLNEPDIAQNTGVYLPGKASQYVALVNSLGQLLDANDLGDVRFSGPNLATTQTNWFATMMDNSYLMSKLAHFGLHSYVGNTPGPDGVDSFIRQSAYPGAGFWMSEFNVWCHDCLNGVGGNDSWTNAQAVAGALLDSLAQGASAALAYEAYDSVYNGYDLGTGEDVPGTWGFWGLFAVDNIYAVPRTYTPRKQFYTLAQITRFVRPGAQRIHVSGAGIPLTLLAFYHANSGQFTLTGVNTNQGTVHVNCSLTSLPAFGSAELYYTDRTNNLLDGGSIPINSGAFTLTVPPDCVFTLAISPQQPGPPGILAESTHPENLITLTLRGPAGATCILETTVDPSLPDSWQPLATNTLDANGLWYFSDVVTSHAQQFYRREVLQ